jgi:hypothetical protein
MGVHVGETVTDVRAPASASGRPPAAVVLAVFLAMTLVLTLVASLSFSAAGIAPADPGLPIWLNSWVQGDSYWYRGIASIGYSYIPGQQSAIAFFPAYPMTVRGVGFLLGGNYVVAGTLIGVLSGAGSAVLFALWVWRRLPRAGAMTAIAILLVYPYAFFLYGAMYGDSLFFLTAIGALMLLEGRHYWLAGLVGAMATAGRPVGVAVAIGLVVRMLEMLAQDRPAAAPTTAAPTTAAPTTAATAAPAPAPPRPGWKDLLRAIPAIRWREAGVLLSGLGLVSWCLYLWAQYGDPLAFVAVQEAPGWYQGSGPRTWFKVVYVGTMIFGPVKNILLLTPQALMCLFALLLLPRVWRRFGWGYTAYALFVLAIPILGTKDFMGTGRYVLVAFPVLAAAGDFLATRGPRWLTPVVLTVLACGLLIATFFYARGVEVS